MNLTIPTSNVIDMTFQKILNMKEIQEQNMEKCRKTLIVKMSTLLHLVTENNDPLETKHSPEVDSWLFMSSPLPILLILVVYLYFVLKFGPQLMKNRPAYNLKGLLILYNAYQVVFSIWLCMKALHVQKSINLLSNTCNNPVRSIDIQFSLSDAAWWYFFSKVIELTDTIFFVLRKKQSQVTFLHVYHHSCTMVFSWAYLKYLPGEQGIVIGFLNSFVHVVMYFYYMVAALGPEYQKYLWWKKYMTWLQLTQFGLMLTYLISIIIMDCKLPRALTFFFVANVVTFLYLFSDFYRKAYKKESNTHKHKEIKIIKSQ